MQRIHLIIALLISLLCIDNVVSRKALRNTPAKKVRSPKVGDYKCFISDKSLTWCTNSVGPFATVGWETEQTYSTLNSIDYWQVRLKPYIQAKIYIQSQFNIVKTYYNELTIDLDQFMANVFGEMMIFKNGNICFNAGW